MKWCKEKKPWVTSDLTAEFPVQSALHLFKKQRRIWNYIKNQLEEAYSMQLFNLDTPTAIHLAINLIFIKSASRKELSHLKVLKVSIK